MKFILKDLGNQKIDSDRFKCWLLLGGSGFIGSHVARAISAAGHKVVIIDNLSTGIRSRVEDFTNLIVGDATDKQLIVDTCKKYDVYGVINLAAFMQARESVRQPIKYWKNNLGVSIALAEAIASSGLTRVVLSSSCSVYGNTRNATDISPLNPLSPYAMTKVASEQVISQACIENNVEFVSLRYFNVIGGGEFPNSIDTNLETLVPSICRKISNAESPIIFGGSLPTKDGTCERDYVDVRDLAEAHLLVSEYGGIFENEYLNVSTGYPVTVLELVNKIIDISKSPAKIIFEEPKSGDPISVSALPSRKLIEMGWRPQFELGDSIKNHWEAYFKNL